MASLSISKSGDKRIRLKGGRKLIWLGKMPKKDAETVHSYVNRLEAAKQVGRNPDADTLIWLTRINPDLHAKLVEVGLVARAVEKEATTLGEHLANYFAKRTDVKPSTLVHWRHAKRSLLAYFGPDRLLTDITAGDARDFERWLKTGKARENRYNDREADEGLAPNTVRKRIGDAKQFFQDAVDRDLLVKNPFAGMKGSVGSNRERDYFVTREEAQKVLDACPDAQWRLLFALSRFGGLRCPSEHLALTWDDVNLPGGRLLVHSPKTEHHEGKGSRLIPIFPELRSHLEAVWDEAEPGNPHVITRYRDCNANLRTQLQRIIRRAGLPVWPKLWQNLRASRATELANEWPAHVAAAWCGHGVAIAQKHYDMVLDSDFERACGNSPEFSPAASETCGNASSKKQQTPVFPEENEGLPYCTSVHVGDEGLEQGAFSSGKTHISKSVDPEFNPAGSVDPAFALLAGAWPALSEEDRKAILAIVRRANEKAP